MQITMMLQNLNAGDQDALHDVIPLVYGELRKLASAQLRRESRAVPLQTTALVHEAYLKLAGCRHPAYENRSHFYGIASRMMRQVLVDTARSRAAGKRAGHEEPFADLPDFGSQPSRSVLALNDALERLEKTDLFKGRLIEMRYFGGLTTEELSVALSTPVYTVRRELRLARAWLRQAMAGENPLETLPES